jgi:hypothetical protein
MNGSGASIAYWILAAFLGGVAIGMLATTAVAIWQEERRFSLSGSAPTAAARGGRWMTGFGGVGSHYRPRHWGRRP